VAWETCKVEKQRLQLIQSYHSGLSSMTNLCRQYGISRKTGYKWYDRFLEFGEEGLRDLSKIPHKLNNCYASVVVAILTRTFGLRS
jgi:putative transposase